MNRSRSDNDELTWWQSVILLAALLVLMSIADRALQSQDPTP